VIQPLWRRDRPFYHTIYRQARVCNVNDWVTYGEIEISGYARIQAHVVDIFVSLIFAYLIVETHDFGSSFV